MPGRLPWLAARTPYGQDSLGALWVPLTELDRHRLSPLAEQALNDWR